MILLYILGGLYFVGAIYTFLIFKAISEPDPGEYPQVIFYSIFWPISWAYILWNI